jgi:hypothetical protein
VDLVKRVLGHGEHSHVRAEFLDERLDDRLGGSIRGHPYALGGNLLPTVLKVEAHHPVELEVLQSQEGESGISGSLSTDRGREMERVGERGGVSCRVRA